MLEAVKLPYYPRLEVYVRHTKNGLMEISNPTIYDTPLGDRDIAKVDTLQVFSDILGVDATMLRKSLYKLVSGDLPEDEICSIVATLYRAYPKFRARVNHINNYIDTGGTLIERVYSDIMDRYKTYSSSVMSKFCDASAKYLVQTHGYVYYSLHKVAAMPDVEGVVVIC